MCLAALNLLSRARLLAGSFALFTWICSLRTQIYFRRKYVCTRRLWGLQWWSWLMVCCCRCREYDLPSFLMARCCWTRHSQVRLGLVWVPRTLRTTGNCCELFLKKNRDQAAISTTNFVPRAFSLAWVVTRLIDYTGNVSENFNFGIAFY